jgi:hypothetical protein
LNDPLNVDDVEVAGQHERLGGIIPARKLRLTAWDCCPKAKFFLEHTRSGNEIYLLDADGKFEVETRTRRSYHATKPPH